MNEKIDKLVKLRWIKYFFAVLVLFWIAYQSFQINRITYDKIPDSGIMDEYTNVWHGLSIRSSGVPAAWSDLRTYHELRANYHAGDNPINIDKFNLRVGDQKPPLFLNDYLKLAVISREYDLGLGKQDFNIVQPYLDHPPLGAVILSLGVSERVQEFKDLNLYEARRTSLIIALFTIFLIFILGYLTFNSLLVGIFSAGVYASVPTYVLSSRLALLENILIPFEIIVMIFLVLVQKVQSREKSKLNTLLVTAGIFSGMCFLIKTTGIFVLMAGVIFLYLNKFGLKKILFFAMPSVLISGLYLVWGFSNSPQLFFEILREQSSRRIFVGSLNFILNFVKFGLKNFPLDGWWMGAFLSLMLLKFNKQSEIIFIGVLSALFVILFTGASSFAWYYIPLIPFMAIATGYFLYRIVSDPRLTDLIVLFLFFFSSSYFWAQGVYGAHPNFNNHQQQFLIYKVFLVLFFAASVLVPRFIQRKNVALAWYIGCLALFFILFKWNIQSFYFILPHWGTLSDYYQVNWKF